MEVRQYVLLLGAIMAEWQGIRFIDLSLSTGPQIFWQHFDMSKMLLIRMLNVHQNNS